MKTYPTKRETYIHDRKVRGVPLHTECRYAVMERAFPYRTLSEHKSRRDARSALRAR